jgi:hypothetical protein
VQIEEITLWTKEGPQSLIFRLDKYLPQQGFKRGIVDNNIYIRTKNENKLIVVVYVDDIIFGGSINKMCQ